MIFMPIAQAAGIFGRYRRSVGKMRVVEHEFILHYSITMVTSSAHLRWLTVFFEFVEYPSLQQLCSSTPSIGSERSIMDISGTLFGKSIIQICQFMLEDHYLILESKRHPRVQNGESSKDKKIIVRCNESGVMLVASIFPFFDLDLLWRQVRHGISSNLRRELSQQYCADEYLCARLLD